MDREAALKDFESARGEFAQAFATSDAAEGLSAYKDKRVAKFEGR